MSRALSRGSARGVRPHGPAAAPRRRSLTRSALLGALVLLSATGCSASWVPNFGFPNPVTTQGRWVLDLWKGSAVTALCIGVIVWGLILWAVVFFRKNSDELPRQVRYNLPIEVLYTALPIVIIVVLFYYTALVETRQDKQTPHPDLTIGVVGFQWNWQFNYVNQGVQITGRPGEPAKLILPADRKIRFIETSPDVIHSFWVPAFLFKRDVVPGRDNQFELTIEKPGTYIGRCAELCGVDHDRMDFFVQVMSPQDYDTWLSGVKSKAATTTAAATTAASTPQALGLPAVPGQQQYSEPAKPLAIRIGSSA